MTSSDFKRAILEKLLSGREHELTATETAEMTQLAEKLARTSSRHHYIPQYYIRAFTGPDRLVSVYDKRQDRIKRNRVGTNGVFFQKERNTIVIDDLKLSLIEDHFFSRIDEDISAPIKRLQVDPVDQCLTLENQSYVNAFMIDLFWRNPITDHAFEDMYQRSTITLIDKEGKTVIDPVRIAELKNDLVHKKMERSRMTLKCIDDILAERLPGRSVAKLWEFEDDLFVLGDYPMLFKSIPENTINLMTMEFFVPLSSTRMFASQQEMGLKNFTVKEVYLFNALIIDQSNDQVCCGNHQVLEKSIAYYKALKQTNLLLPLKHKLFERSSNANIL